MVDVSGQKGDFTVTVRKKPRYIDMDKCIACGACTGFMYEGLHPARTNDRHSTTRATQSGR